MNQIYHDLRNSTSFPENWLHVPLFLCYIEKKYVLFSFVIFTISSNCFSFFAHSLNKALPSYLIRLSSFQNGKPSALRDWIENIFSILKTIASFFVSEKKRKSFWVTRPRWRFEVDFEQRDPRVRGGGRRRGRTSGVEQLGTRRRRRHGYHFQRRRRCAAGHRRRHGRAARLRRRRCCSCWALDSASVPALRSCLALLLMMTCLMLENL